MEEIYVDWSGPYTYEDVVNYNENKIETKKFAVKPTDFGLYQIFLLCLYFSNLGSLSVLHFFTYSSHFFMHKRRKCGVSTSMDS